MAGKDIMSVEKKVEIVRPFSVSGGNAAETRRMLYQKGVEEGKWYKCGLGKVPIPSRVTISNIIQHFPAKISGLMKRNIVRNS